MKSLRDLTGRHAFLISLYGDRGAVHVTSRDHQDTIAFHPMVSCEYVRRIIAASNLTYMQRSVRIRPGDADEYVVQLTHLFYAL